MRQNVVLRFIAISLACFTLTGCIHYEHKSAEGKPWDEVATIRQFDKSLSISKIDDDTSLYWLARQTEYRLGAGRHKLSVKHAYGLYGRSSMKWWYYEVRDLETGRSAKVMDPAATAAPSEPVEQPLQ
jgi:hypothetical protein